MNKKIGLGAAAVIVLGAAYLGGSWWMGGQVQGIYQKQVARAQEVLAGQATVAQDYQRGLLASSGDTVITLAPEVLGPEAGDTPLTVHVHHDIRHALFSGGRLAAAVDHTTVTGVEGVPQELQDAVALDDKAQAITVYALDGSYDSQVSLPAGKLDVSEPAGPQVRMSWPASTYQVKGPGDLSRVSGSLRLDGLDLQVAEDETQMQLVLGRTEGRFEMEPGEGSWLFAPSTSSASVAQLQMNLGTDGEPMRPWLDLQDLKVDAGTRRDGQLLTLAQKLATRGQVAQIPLEELRWELELERLDADAMAQLQPYLTAISAADDPAAAFPDAQEVLEPILRQLADAGPGYTSRWHTTLGGESGLLDLRIALEPATDDAQPLPGLPWQMELLPRIRGQASVKLPKSWLDTLATVVQEPQVDAEQMQEQLDMLVMMGYLKDEDGIYAAEASYDADGLVLNGKKLFGGL